MLSSRTRYRQKKLSQRLPGAASRSASSSAVNMVAGGGSEWPRQVCGAAGVPPYPTAVQAVRLQCSVTSVARVRLTHN